MQDSDSENRQENLTPQAEFDAFTHVVKKQFDQVHQTLGSVTAGLDHVTTMVTAISQNVEKNLRVQAAMLTTVQSIDARVSEMSNHDERISRLENEVFSAGPALGSRR